MMPNIVIQDTSARSKQALMDHWFKLFKELREVENSNKWVIILRINKKEPLMFWRTPWGFMMQYEDDWRNWYKAFEQREMCRVQNMRGPVSDKVPDNSSKSKNNK